MNLKNENILDNPFMPNGFPYRRLSIGQVHFCFKCFWVVYFFLFLNFNGTFCEQAVDPDQMLRSAASGSAMFACVPQKYVVVSCWERTNLLALLYVMLYCVLSLSHVVSWGRCGI